MLVLYISIHVWFFLHNRGDKFPDTFSTNQLIILLLGSPYIFLAIRFDAMSLIDPGLAYLY
jgi:hypothetical protein